VPIIVQPMPPHRASLTAETNRQTLQHTGMALPDPFLGCLGRTLSAHHHDDRMLQQAFPPELDWCIAINVRVDCGSRGRPSDSKGERMEIPTKKPRQSKKPPKPPWSDAPKAANTVWSPVRICIEQAIGGMKRDNILVHTFRNRIKHFEDDVIGICAGLWHLVLSY